MGEERAARPQLDPLHGILLWCVVVGDGLVAGRGVFCGGCSEAELYIEVN